LPAQHPINASGLLNSGGFSSYKIRLPQKNSFHESFVSKGAGENENVRFRRELTLSRARGLVFLVLNDLLRQFISDLEGLKWSPWLKNAPGVFAKLEEQLPAYLAIISDVKELPEGGASAWWGNKAKAAAADATNVAHSISGWVEVARYVLVLQPSSAIAERVFSIIKRLFGDYQARTLSDLIELAVWEAMDIADEERKMKQNE